MRLIKPAIIGIIGLSVLVTLISLLLPSEVHGRRGLVINAPADKIRLLINDFGNWPQWHPNFKPDSSKLTFGKTTTGTDGRCWLERNGKTDEFVFTLSNDSIINAVQKRKGENDVELLFTLTKDQASTGTYVDWKFITHLKWYPWEKFSGFFTESFTAPGMEQGLENIRKIAEGH